MRQNQTPTTPWRLVAMCVLSWCSAVVPTLRAEPPVFAGPFEVRQFLAFYVVNPGGEAFTLRLKWREDARALMDRPILVRVFDPEEHLLLRHDAPGEKSDTIEQSVDLNIPAGGAGVYQVAITGFRPTLEFATDPPLSFGLFGYPDLAIRDDQFVDAYVHLPPTLTTLTIRSGEGSPLLRLADETGREIVSAAGLSSATANLPTSGEHVWRISARAKGVATLNFAGMPIILCPDEKSARAIHSSVDVLDDGTICFHKFQVRAQEILKRYRAMPPSAFEVRPPVMIRYKQSWLADSVRNRLLLGPYGVYSGLDVVLNEQVLNGTSPWFGCIYNWRDESGRMRQGDPWKRIDRLGMTRAASTITTLAAVYSIREAFNPLAGSETLRNRVIIAAMQEMMMLREHEMPLPEYIEYPGAERAFTFARYTLSFPLAVRDCPEDVRAVWTEGLQRCVDHQMLGVVPNTANQWTFTIRGLQQFSEGIDDPWYGEMVRRSVHWLLTRNQDRWGWMAAGYFAESGPDATYNGISVHNLGWVWRRTSDAELKEALRRCIDLFNHTVAPEPDGAWQEATSFASRTPDGWSKPQWAVGFGMLMGELPEAIPVVRASISQVEHPANAARLRAAEQDTNSVLTYLDRQAFSRHSETVLLDAADIHFAAWQAFADRTLDGRLPVVEAAEFTRVFGDEFMCVRRPSYYAFVYAGSPMDDWQKASRERDARKQYPRNGGGLCMFWTPSFGSSLLAKNWSAYAAQCVIVERANGAIDWEDYWSVQPKFDVERSTAHITATILDQPIHLSREIRFLEQSVECFATLAVEPRADVRAAFETFPFPAHKPTPLRVSLLDAHGLPVNDGGLASAILFDAGGSEVHLVVFEPSRRCRVRLEHTIDHYQHQREHGCVLAEIPGAQAAGESRVRWLVTSAGASSVAARISQSIQALRAK